MKLNIINGNIFDSDAEAIILTIDGSHKGLEGNITREFKVKFPDLWTRIEKDIHYPLQLGQVFTHICDNDLYDLVFVLSTLNHLEELDDKAIKNINFQAFKNCLKLAKKAKIKSIATTLLTGGWRVNPLNAFLIISNAIETTLTSDDELSVNIYIKNLDNYNKVSNFAKSIGW